MPEPAGGRGPGEEEGEVPISAIEHYSYCPRQCALIHVDQTFEENLFTMRGHRAHERVHGEEDSTVRGIPVKRGFSLWSERFGLRGKADVVEFHPDGPYPVEYKVGHRLGIHADLQLCAQALCLEEMLHVRVPRGALFYWAVRRRHEVVIDADLRRMTLEAIERIRDLMRTQRLPNAPNDARCRNCSLINACLPAEDGRSLVWLDQNGRFRRGSRGRRGGMSCSAEASTWHCRTTTASGESLARSLRPRFRTAAR